MGRLPDLRTQNNQNLCPKASPAPARASAGGGGGGGATESIDIHCKVGGDSWAPGVASLLHDHV